MEYLTEYHVQLVISYLCLFYFMVPTYLVLKLRKKESNQQQNQWIYCCLAAQFE